MSRRDTIIVAALINAGLLIVLFVSALKNQEDSEKLVLKKEAPDLINSEVIVRTEPKKMIGDEVEQVLKQYTQQDPLQIPVAAVVPEAPVVHSFAEDLQVFAQETPLAATIQPAVLQEETPAVIEVKVKKGDVLEKIARHHNTSVSEIMKLNHLSSTQLKIGQVLKISSKGNLKSPPKVEAIVAESGPSKFYSVKAGDNLWTIAVKNHVKVEDLLKVNNMTEEKARKLKPGDQIRIR